MSAVLSQMGGLQIVVNNAAINEWQRRFGLTTRCGNDVWQRSLDTNLVGPANVMFWAAPAYGGTRRMANGEYLLTRRFSGNTQSTGLRGE